MSPALLILLLCPAADPTAGPKTSSKVTYQCHHIDDKDIKIDGQLDDAAWQRAKPMTDFTLVRTDGQRAKFATTSRLLWSDKHLFVSFDCAIDGIRSAHTERDATVWDSEAVELFVCPRGAEAVYYEIDFSPRNVIYDSRVESWKYEDQVKNWQKWAKGFNAKIVSATMIHKNDGNVSGWSLEAAIPFADLDVAGSKPPVRDDVWLFNAFRVAQKADGTQELGHWQPVKPEFHRPMQFPKLKFVNER
jgi:hypothetical protein